MPMSSSNLSADSIFPRDLGAVTGVNRHSGWKELLEIQVVLLYVFILNSTVFLSALRSLKLVSSPVACDTEEHRCCNG